MAEGTDTPRVDARLDEIDSPDLRPCSYEAYQIADDEIDRQDPNTVGTLIDYAWALERMWRTAEAAREKLEQDALAIQSAVRTPKADERLARLQRRADHIRNRPPLSEAGKHRDRAECSALDWVIARNEHLERELQSARKDAAAKQARIDELMLEYCPDEMTDEQRAEWSRNQRSVSKEEQSAIRALGEAGRE